MTTIHNSSVLSITPVTKNLIRIDEKGGSVYYTDKISFANNYLSFVKKGINVKSDD